MLSPELTAVIMLILFVVLVVIIPFLDGYPKTSKYISLRYILTSFALILTAGVLLDFSHLSNDVRYLVILCSFILVGLFILCRSLEKSSFLKKLLLQKEIKIQASKSDLKGSLEIHDKDNKEN